MPSDLVVMFSRAIVARLVRDGLLALRPEATLAQVADHVAQALSVERAGQQLITTVGRALEACPLVEDLYADDEALSSVASDLAQ